MLLPASVSAALQINILGTDGVWPDSRTVNVEELRTASESFETTDPNFTSDGMTRYTGVRLSKLLALTGTDGSQGLTVIGADQYVGFLPQERVAQGYLVWEMNNAPILGLKGGPLKIMFPASAGIHLSCYTWYVDTLVAGPVDKAVLPVTVMGGKRTLHTRKELLAHAGPIDPVLFSIAQGCRNEFKGFKKATSVSAVPLAHFLSLDKGGKTTVDQATAIVFKPFSGPTITLPPALLNFPVFIMVASDGRPLHPALGGPFSVVFPVEKYPELQDMVPESGALFFLKEIVVR
ncbi:MAG: molybdopterin-dependent oxidoreductase [Desulfobacterales bacterium]|nr:molybdopterin-dependent oxidoreductase [Desulfobacterales bacterium]